MYLNVKALSSIPSSTEQKKKESMLPEWLDQTFEAHAEGDTKVEVCGFPKKLPGAQLLEQRVGKGGQWQGCL